MGAPTTPRFAYVANRDSDAVSMYTVNAQTGQLRHNGYVMAGAGAFSVAVDPSSKYAYVANYRASTISQFTIGTDGTLSAMTPATVASGANPTFITVDPSGKYAYAANNETTTVSQYSIGSNGALTPMSPPSIDSGQHPARIAIDPSGKYAYVANDRDTIVSQFTIGSAGALARMTPASVTTGTTPTSVAIDPTGKYAYVSCFGSGAVFQYTIGANGALSAMSPASVASGASPAAVTVDPTGKYAYVANYGAGSISQYSIGTDGKLAPMSTPTVAAEVNPNDVVVDASGKYAYATNFGSDTVSRYTIGPSGALTAAPVMPSITTQDSPTNMYVSRGFTPVSYTPRFGYNVTAAGNLQTYSVNPTTGALTKVGTDVPAGAFFSESLGAHPSGRYVYVAARNADQSITAKSFSIDAATGAPTHVGTDVGVGDPFSGITMEPSGRFAFLVSGLPDTYVMTLGVNSATGALAFFSNIGPHSGARKIAVAPAGRFAFEATGSVLTHGINSTSGGLTQASFVLSGGSALAVTVHPSGRFAYVPTYGNFVYGSTIFWNRGLVNVFAINTTNGALTAGSTAVVGDLPGAAAIDPSGRFAYVLNGGTWIPSRGDFDRVGSLTTFSIDQSTGALTAVGTPISFTGTSSGTAPDGPLIDPSGRFVYVPTGSGYSKFSIDQSTGALTALGTEAAVSGPVIVMTSAVN